MIKKLIKIIKGIDKFFDSKLYKDLELLSFTLIRFNIVFVIIIVLTEKGILEGLNTLSRFLFVSILMLYPLSIVIKTLRKAFKE